MFSALWWVPFSAGLQDGINPCTLINGALILLGLLWLKKSGYKRLWFLLLITIMLLFHLAINCGIIDKFILNKYFEIIARSIYTLLALWLAWQGIKFLRQWREMISGKQVNSDFSKVLKLSGLQLSFVLILVGYLLSLLASVWPINYYIVVFSAYMYLPGQFTSMLLFLGIYSFTSLWFIYLCIGIVSLEKINQRLFKIVTAGILLSASISTVILWM